MGDYWASYSYNKPRQADQISARSSLQFARCAGRYVEGRLGANNIF